jgi:hypothetical protein
MLLLPFLDSSSTTTGNHVPARLYCCCRWFSVLHKPANTPAYMALKADGQPLLNSCCSTAAAAKPSD